MESQILQLKNLPKYPHTLPTPANFESFVVSPNKALISEKVKNAEVYPLAVRFNMWRVFLGVVDAGADWEVRAEQVTATRKKYAELRGRHGNRQVVKEVGSAAPVSKNPLGMLIKSPSTLEKTPVAPERHTLQQISKDLLKVTVQLGPFTASMTRSLMSNILVTWCNENIQIGFNQSLCQILARIVYVYCSNCVFKVTPQDLTEPLKEKYMFMNSWEFAEADVYAVFDRVMLRHKDMFLKENDRKTNVNPNSRNNTPILQRIGHLWDILLKAADLELFRHMRLMEVNPRSFLSKWLKTILLSQFGFQQCMVVWDNIFLNSLIKPLTPQFPTPQLPLLDFFCVAMLVYLRAVALNKSTAFQITQLYERFPTVNGIYLQQLVNLAWMVEELCEEVLAREAKGEEVLVNPRESNLITKDYLEREDTAERSQEGSEDEEDADGKEKEKGDQVIETTTIQHKPVPVTEAVVQQPVQQPVQSTLQPPTEPIIPRKPSTDSNPNRPKGGQPLNIPKSDNTKHSQIKLSPQLAKQSSNKDSKPQSKQQPTPKPPSSSQPPKPPTPSPTQLSQNDPCIILTLKQWKQLQATFKKSIDQNTYLIPLLSDLESKALSLKVMKLLQAKQQQSRNKRKLQ